MFRQVSLDYLDREAGVSLPRVTVHIDLHREKILTALGVLIVEELTAVAAWPEAGLLTPIVWRLD
jgi:hypothetical protein